MNVILHTTTAISVAVLLTDTKRIEQSTTSNNVTWTSFWHSPLDLFHTGRWTTFRTVIRLIPNLTLLLA